MKASAFPLLFVLMAVPGTLAAEFAYKSVYSVNIPPARMVDKGAGNYFVEFPKAAFGTIDITLTGSAGQQVKVIFGEKSDGDSVDFSLRADVVAKQETLTLEEGTHTYRVVVHPKFPAWATAVQSDPLFPTLPFRYIEIMDAPSPLTQADIKQIAVFYPFDENASSFTSDNEILNKVWDFCKYSLKACSWLGIYVDGNRERTPYEADSYIQQLGHYCQDTQAYAIARHTQEFLFKKPTWPAEWKFHSIFMAWTDYLWTGDESFLSKHYNQLKTKTLSRYARPDGLICPPGSRGWVGENAHIVDWPGQYRDGYDFQKYNTVVNALYYKTLVTMAEAAKVLGKETDARTYQDKAMQVQDSFQKVFFDTDLGYYRDGEDSNHYSLHANLFPLAVGLVPQDKMPGVVQYIKSRGMACSVYAAQYLIEGLYRAGEGQYALDLLSAGSGENSWYNMIDLGSTITTEAWDAPWNPNENGGDWNHAWGAAPANLIPLGLMGIKPLEPGFGKIQFKPQTGNLGKASVKIPTIKGSVAIEIRKDTSTYTITVDVPADATAKVYVPMFGKPELGIKVDGAAKNGIQEGAFVFLDNLAPGRHVLVRSF